MKFGRYEVTLLEAGRFKLDGGAMFGVVPKVLWERHKPADEKNRIAMATNLLLIQGEGRNILVDTGLGNKYSAKFKDMYAIEDGFTVERALATVPLTVDDITDVIITHLHFDHAGGNTIRDHKGEIRPTFPHARYYLQRQQYEWANRPSEKDRASYFPENVMPVKAAGQLELLDEGGPLFPDIELIVVNGHTPGQQLVRVAGEERSLLFAGDLIPLAPQVAIPWIMAYDLYPLTTLQEKKEILNRAAEEDCLLIFEHDRDIQAATVHHTEKGFAIKPVVTF